jgi:hypothetical protein
MKSSSSALGGGLAARALVLTAVLYRVLPVRPGPRYRHERARSAPLCICRGRLRMVARAAGYAVKDFHRLS